MFPKDNEGKREYRLKARNERPWKLWTSRDGPSQMKTQVDGRFCGPLLAPRGSGEDGNRGRHPGFFGVCTLRVRLYRPRRGDPFTMVRDFFPLLLFAYNPSPLDDRRRKPVTGYPQFVGRHTSVEGGGSLRYGCVRRVFEDRVEGPEGASLGESVTQESLQSRLSEPKLRPVLKIVKSISFVPLLNTHIETQIRVPLPPQKTKWRTEGKVCGCTRTSVCVHMCVHVRRYVCLGVYMCMSGCVWVSICVCEGPCVRPRVWVRVCPYVSMCVSVCEREGVERSVSETVV